MFEPLTVGIAGAAAVLVLFLAAVNNASYSARRQRARIERFVIGEATAGGVAVSKLTAQESLIRLLVRIGRPLARRPSVRATAAASRRLTDAGSTGIDGAEFVQLRFGTAIVVAAAVALLALVVSPGLASALFGTLIGAALGYLIPGLVLTRRLAARKKEILVALPAVLDMLALCADAGLGLDGGMQQVAQRWDNALTVEIRRFLVELRIGRDRRQAIREMAKRTGLAEVSRFANAVVQADTLGVPLARVLQEQAAEVRGRRRQRAEEQARKAPIKMLFPMVLLIFPALFIVILGPVVPRLMGAFTGVQ